jgi:hypothetical protein
VKIMNTYLGMAASVIVPLALTLMLVGTLGQLAALRAIVSRAKQVSHAVWQEAGGLDPKPHLWAVQTKKRRALLTALREVPDPELSRLRLGLTVAKAAYQVGLALGAYFVIGLMWL